MSVGRVNVDAAHENLSTIKRLLNSQLEILSSYAKLVDSFEGTWSGQGYVAYKRVFSELSPKAIDHFSNMDSYNNQISHLLDQFGKADMDSKRQFDNV